MSPPTSDLFDVQSIPKEGRGVIASKTLQENASVLTSLAPVAHVVLREYRKEVCANCFSYDRGRTLPERDHTTGHVFCTPACQQQWAEEQGPLGMEAWQALEMFVRTKRKAINQLHSQMSVQPISAFNAVKYAWKTANERAQLQKAGRCSSASDSGPGVKAQKEYRKAVHHTWTSSVDPDILSFLLSGVLYHHNHADKWDEILDLEPDKMPYKSVLDLEAHTGSFLQLVAILPHQLLPSINTEICQALIDRTAHNSFGIRNELGEEYFGYALYPSASYFNHSCEPNVSKVRKAKEWSFSMSKDAQSGDQLCITYLGGDEKDMTVTERRSLLKKNWGFECGCRRCLEESAAAAP